MARAHEPRIVIVGGGFGGLEAAFYLKMRLGDRAKITLISGENHFLFKPNTIYIPFGLDPGTLKIPLRRPTQAKGINFIHAAIRGIDPVGQTVQVAGQALPYDYLILATGAGMRPEEIPGLRNFAQTIWTPQDMLRLRVAFDALLDAARLSQRRRVLFLVPPSNKCSGPLYEMVLMLDTWLRRKHARAQVDITWTTYEAGYIQAFGPRLHDVVTGEFARRGITGRTQYVGSVR